MDEDHLTAPRSDVDAPGIFALRLLSVVRASFESKKSVDFGSSGRNGPERAYCFSGCCPLGSDWHYCLAVVPGGRSFAAHESSANIGRRSQSLGGVVRASRSKAPGALGRAHACGVDLERACHKMRSESLSWSGDQRARGT